jgi:nitrous oxidase accessory protein
MFSNNDVYDGNIFKNNGTGVAVMFSKNIEMINNIFLENWGSASFGLLFKEIYDGKLYRNVFQENTVGLYADGANRIEIIENEFIKNGWAINMLGNSQDNTISRNNFLSNTFDVATNTKTNPNLFEGNYWDQYTGYDLDKDGIGDVPFRPIKVFSYVISKIPESIILLRSLFIDMLNFAEKVAPVLTPDTLFDEAPKMTRLEYD